MAKWRTVGTVVAGAIVTVILGILILILLPFLGFVTSEVVGNWLPIWVFTIPLAMCAIAGGATVGFLQGNNRKSSAILGGLAGALGFSVIGLILGLIFLMIMLGMTPAHGQETDVSKAARTVVALGGGFGFVAGAVLGAIGGVSGHIGRQEPNR